MVQLYGALIALTILPNLSLENLQVCDRRPLGTKAAPLPPDERFQLSVNGIIDNKYIPNQKYTVSLFSSDHESTFIAFSIAIQEDTAENPDNPRRPIPLKPGFIFPSPDSNDATVSQICGSTVLQSNSLPKKSVTVIWTAPPKDQGCVTIYAVLAVTNEVWYSNEGPLIKKICEDRRQKDDMPPQLNNDCMICEDARYQLTFKGIWTYNTHPEQFPENRELAAFSDLIGASHNNNFQLWKFNKEASFGLQMLAEQGNTTGLEMEIQEQFGSGVRTIIKAKGPTEPTAPTYATFRVSKDYHRISFVTSILPSPDWFLGVSHLELCGVNNKWATDVTLNLYPLDAGTDSGKTFDSPNDMTSPPQPINSVHFNIEEKTENKGNGVKPFARLQINLVRTYERPDCTDVSTSTQLRNLSTDDGDSGGSSENSAVLVDTSSVSTSSPVKYDEGSSLDCPVTEWEDWLPCTGVCINGNLRGLRMRFRYHLVDGVPIDKYDENVQVKTSVTVPDKCLEDYPGSETGECEEDQCESSSESPILNEPILPGQRWDTTF